MANGYSRIPRTTPMGPYSVLPHPPSDERFRSQLRGRAILEERASTLGKRQARDLIEGAKIHAEISTSARSSLGARTDWYNRFNENLAQNIRNYETKKKESKKKYLEAIGACESGDISLASQLLEQAKALDRWFRDHKGLTRKIEE